MILGRECANVTFLCNFKYCVCLSTNKEDFNNGNSSHFYIFVFKTCPIVVDRSLKFLKTR